MKPPSTALTLSVLLVTYNHEEHIDQALDSLFGQDYPGQVELTVADDASKDSTLEKIRAREGHDSRFIFKYLASPINLGITKNYQRGFSSCSGDYIAVLEGDDYWISPRKLSRQVKFLDEHWECDLCAVNYYVLEELKSEFSARSPIGLGHRLLSARNLIADNLVGNFSTCVYRRSALAALPAQLFELRSYDWIVNICVASRSLIGFIEEPLSVYRVHSSGAWSGQEDVEKLELQQLLLPAYDQLTERRFHAEFERLNRDLSSSIALSRARSLANGTPLLKSSTLMWIRQLVPPIVVWTLRAFLPPILMGLLVKLGRRARGA